MPVIIAAAAYDLASVSALYAASRELTTGPGIVMPGVLAFGAADGMLHAVNVTTTPASVVWSHLSGGSTVASKPVSNGVHVAYGSVRAPCWCEACRQHRV